MHKFLFCTLAALCVGAAPAWGASRVEGFAVGVDAGTLGAGLSLSRAVEPGRLGVELDVHALSLSHGYTGQGVDYRGTLRMRSVGVIANWFPWHGPLHLSAGLFYDGNRWDLQAQPGPGGLVINGHAYTSSQLGALHGQVRFQAVAPYLGVGWGDATAGAGWHLTARAGVLYQGSPTVDLTADTPYATNSQAYRTLYADIDAQRQRIRADLGRLRWYPVLAVGLSYRF